MRTLGKTHTDKFFISPETGFDDLCTAWKKACHDKSTKLTASDHLAYLLLKGKDWTKSFKPSNKEHNDTVGRSEGLYVAWMYLLVSLKSEPFAGLIDPMAAYKGIQLHTGDWRRAKSVVEGQDEPYRPVEEGVLSS